LEVGFVWIFWIVGSLVWRSVLTDWEEEVEEVGYLSGRSGVWWGGWWCLHGRRRIRGRRRLCGWWGARWSVLSA